MEFKNIIISIIACLFVTLVSFNFANFMNDSYVSEGGEVIDTGFYDDFAPNIQSNITNIYFSLNDYNNTGVTTTSTSTAFAEGLNTFQTIKFLVGFVPNLLSNGATYLGINDSDGFGYVSLAKWTFGIAFAITLAYLLVLGVKRFIA